MTGKTRSAHLRDRSQGGLRVSGNGRFLEHADGTPFLWLADTAWELLHRLTRGETRHYLGVRAAQGFTVVQTVVLAELGGLTVPTPEGELPFHDLDPARPNEAYFAKLDWLLEEAAAHGLGVALLPTWGDKVQRWWGEGPEVFSPRYRDQGGGRATALARDYGRFLGERLRDVNNLVWVLGGDRDPLGLERYPGEGGPEVLKVWRALADGLRSGDGGRHLLTFHPSGGRSSSDPLHAEAWLDFNMIQSGHSRAAPAGWELVARDRALTPVKPTLDGEPCYEDHPAEMNPAHGWFGAGDARRAAYGAVFAGALGHTYGAHGVWQMFAEGRAPVSYARTNWQASLTLPFAAQVRHLRHLMLEHDFARLEPDPRAVSRPGSGRERALALRGPGRLLVYLPHGRTFTLRDAALYDAGVRNADGAASWFDPRTGASHPAVGTTFESPSPDDWVLVVAGGA